MRILSESRQPLKSERKATYVVTAAAVAATAFAGARAVDADSDWYRSLKKPAWQPPSWAFGAVWTPLYVSIAWADGRGLNRAHASQRVALAASVGANLVLNAVWNHLFFRRQSPRAGMAGTVLLDISNLQLVRKMTGVDRPAARALVPYTAWCLFATALNASLVRRNSARR
ncbi:TspO/MBR family protein [Streptomyces sp. NPDC005281]|uniref:TspO/MBR family protein n=1 Tax=Streptomyces sp. NPDC005281 TaxID=3155712 RepID=UPI0033AF43DD